ncbi:GNAT family N-acetyltransferase [Massilia sp. S19_KUP03_FR1]|uniref:GNAT family N-acetyltransferase n=1 Tax=Massilia sp. S19_KUP03_FR1 TaxID=3025503 RepID=UPI002FCD8504
MLACPSIAYDWTFQVGWAASEDEVAAAQRLRFDVFAGEMGAQLQPDAMAARLDRDCFDPFCEHLLVWAVERSGQAPRQLVGTYRVLTPAGARQAGGLYADQEFDLAPLDHLRSHMVELGRACVSPAWRSGGVILALWSALGQYMVQHRFDTMVGCASVALADACALWHGVRHTYLARQAWQVQPRCALVLVDAVPLALRAMPPLIKGYLRGGAKVLGPPSWDASFGTADLPIMMRMDELSARYRAQFLTG